MNKFLTNATRTAMFIAAILLLAGAFPDDANAQRYLCNKIGGSCTKPTAAEEEKKEEVIEEEVEAEEQTEDEVADEDEREDIPPPRPTVGNVAWSFISNLTGASALVTTESNSSIKTSLPDVTTTRTKTRRGWSRWGGGTSYTKTGSIKFETDDYRRSCAWITTTIPIDRKNVRIYYSLKISKDKEKESGDGTVLAFLPGTTTPSKTLCGGYGEYLGFGDQTNYSAMVKPRFGIEYDSAITGGLSDPNYNHLAIVGEGNTHNGTLAPVCPASSTANVTSSPYGACWTGDNSKTKSSRHGSKNSYGWLEDGNTHKFRTEIKACAGNNGANNCTSQGCATTDVFVKSWVCAYGASCYNSSSFQSVANAYSGSASAIIQKCVPFNQATNPSMLVGFTNGAGDHDTEFTYGSFAMMTSDIP
ncbi:MAG: hypothetical protein OEL53_15165 [Rhodospirillales bacterium]|nr:hypothetical protein [Rhodospirillales bacterium]